MWEKNPSLNISSMNQKESKLTSNDLLRLLPQVPYYANVKYWYVFVLCANLMPRRSNINPEKLKECNQMKKPCEYRILRETITRKIYFVLELMHSVVNLLFCGSKCTFILFII
jgi:hypothetical protein